MTDPNKGVRASEYQRRFAMLVATAWRDAEFAKRLTDDPAACFSEFGIEFPKQAKVIVHQDTQSVVNIVIPLKPSDFGEPLQMEVTDNCWRSSKCWNTCD